MTLFHLLISDVIKAEILRTGARFTKNLTMLRFSPSLSVMCVLSVYLFGHPCGVCNKLCVLSVYLFGHPCGVCLFVWSPMWCVLSVYLFGHPCGVSNKL